jgi:ABC-type bacteriocin/lantibiotic exporter with double-glycine peptidase domain
MQILKKLLFLLTIHERKNVIFLMGMVLVLAMLEMIGVVSILPFMAVLMSPELIDTNIVLNAAFNNSSLFGVETKNEFLFLLGIVVFLILITTLTFKFLTYYVQLRFTTSLNYKIAKRFVEGYLHQPYSWFLNRHSADLGKNILSEVSFVISQGMNPMINFIKQSVVCLAIVIMLFFVDPILTLIVGLTFGSAYGLMYLIIKKFMSNIGQSRLDANKWMFISISDAFGAIKEIKVSGQEQTYINRFSEPAKILAKVSALAGVISNLPRFVLEAITFGGMLLIVLYLMSQKGNFITALPIISLYAYAAYRLIPTV